MLNKEPLVSDLDSAADPAVDTAGGNALQSGYLAHFQPVPDGQR